MLSQITHACAYHTHACMHTHTRSLHTSHTKQTKQSKACETQLLPPSEPTLGCLCTCASKSFWGRATIVTHRRSHGERLQNPKFHNNSNTTKQDKDSWAFASPVNTTYHIDVTTGSAPCRSPGPQYTAG